MDALTIPAAGGSDRARAPADSARGVRRAPRLFERLSSLRIDRRRAVPIAVGIALLAGLIDAITVAEAVFTLFYLIPIGVAAWFHGRRAAYAVVALCSVLGLAVDVSSGPHRAHEAFLAWNFLGELGLYLLFTQLLDLLKRKISTEAALRKEALSQLRHADRLTTIGRLAAGLAHELGTPLNVVSGKASLISSGRIEGDDVKKSAVVIEQQADRMTAIIRHLLDFARRGGTRREATNLRALVEETAELLRPLGKRFRSTIRCEGADVLAPVNPSELQQVLSNLITNAIHAMPKGGEVRITSALEDGQAVLKVADQGTGIPPHVLPRIFDPFFTTKDVGEGTGLGLSVVHGIIDDHGGTIEVESEPGHGTTFVLRLPGVVTGIA